MDNIYEMEEVCSEFESEYGSKTMTVECAIDTTDKGGISKLLSVVARARNINSEVCAEGVKTINQVNYMVMYLDANGNEQCLDYLSDFNHIFPKCDGFSDKYFRSDVCVMDIDNEVSGSSIKLQTVVGVKVFGIKESCCKCVKCDDDDVLKRCNDVCVQSFAGEIKEHFGVVEDYESGGSVQKILCFDSSAIVKKIVINNDKMNVSGEIVATVSYICDETLTNKSFNIPFSEEIKLPKRDRSCDNIKANIFADVTDRKIILSGSADNNIMCLQFNVCVAGALYDSEIKQYVMDMYSSKQELELDYHECGGYCFDGVVQMSDKVYGSSVVRDDMLPARKIITTNIARNCIANTYYENDRIMVDGLLACNVVYEDIDTNTCTMLVEVPYVVEAEKDGLSAKDMFTASCIAELMTTKIKGDRDIEVSAMLSFVVSINKYTEIKCVCSVKAGAMKDNENFAITIYCPQDGEDLWTIAKNINASMEEIVHQNPELKDGNCKRIVFYRQI